MRQTPLLTLLAVAVLCAGLSKSAELPSSTRAASSSSQSWWANAVFYQVFVRSFQDSNNDGIGDFQGLRSRLGYLKELGVDALWLMPIFESPSYHGYDVTDYSKPNPQYGTLEDFKSLLHDAHQQGFKVILDWIPNHSSSQHPWFSESRNPSSPKRDWYVWRKDNPGWKQPTGSNNAAWNALDGAYYYSAFWSGMPDLNWRAAGVQQAMQDAAKYWLDQGIDGYRVDAVPYMIENSNDNTPNNAETLAWFEQFSGFVKSINPQATVVGEIWAGVSTVAPYLKGQASSNLAFNFELQKALKDTLGSSRRDAVERALTAVAREYPKDAVDAIFISNHDQPRPRYFGANKPRNAADLLLTLPGTPFIYYGEEIGLPNGLSNDDKDKRNPMRWDETPNAGFSNAEPWWRFSSNDPSISVAAQRAKADSLWNHYRKLIHIRQANPALRAGAYAPLEAGERMFASVRSSQNQNIITVLNLDSDPARSKLDLSKLPRGSVQELTLGKTLPALTDANASAYPVQLNGAGLLLLEIKP